MKHDPEARKAHERMMLLLFAIMMMAVGALQQPWAHAEASLWFAECASLSMAFIGML